jgi:hypothetical protein
MDEVRFQAARWVVVLGRVRTVLLVLAACGALLATAFTWSLVAPVTAAVLAGLAAAWNALVDGFARHRRGAWAALVVVTGLETGVGLAAWVLGADADVLDVLGAVFVAVLLGLLLHADTRDWVARPGAARTGGLAPGAGMAQDHRRPPVQVTEEQP